MKKGPNKYKLKVRGLDRTKYIPKHAGVFLCVFCFCVVCVRVCVCVHVCARVSVCVRASMHATQAERLPTREQHSENNRIRQSDHPSFIP